MRKIIAVRLSKAAPLTAEGRISALVLGLLPVGLGLVMYSINREYMNVLLHDSFGQVLLIAMVLRRWRND